MAPSSSSLSLSLRRRKASSVRGDVFLSQEASVTAAPRFVRRSLTRGPRRHGTARRSISTRGAVDRARADARLKKESWQVQPWRAGWGGPASPSSTAAAVDVVPARPGRGGWRRTCNLLVQVEDRACAIALGMCAISAG